MFIINLSSSYFLWFIFYLYRNWYNEYLRDYLLSFKDVSLFNCLHFIRSFFIYLRNGQFFSEIVGKIFSSQTVFFKEISSFCGKLISWSSPGKSTTMLLIHLLIKNKNIWLDYQKLWLTHPFWFHSIYIILTFTVDLKNKIFLMTWYQNISPQLEII